MDVLIALEHRFTRTPDGAVWTATGLAREHWDRYLGTFARVGVLARVLDVAEPAPGARRVDGGEVSVAGVPHYVGPLQYAARRGSVRRGVWRALEARPEAAVILRVPGLLGTLAGAHLRGRGRPFGVEVIGDPHDVFAPGTLDHPLRPLLRAWSTRALRRLCAEASAALYVTSAALQRRYPSRPGAAFAASDAEMGDAAYVDRPRAPRPAGEGRFRIVTVGTLEQLYKSPDVLLRAIARAAGAGLDAELVLVGDGRRRPELEALARSLGIAGRVRFAGHLPAGEAVRRELDAADLFVLPSRTEGMPRALVEAMARGLPCLATAVGGVPELLPPEALVPCDPAALAARIVALAADPAARAAHGRRNLARARDFHERALQPIRAAFHSHLAGVTASREPAPAASLPARGAR